ncbi:MAG: YihY/virulence factor BrkB family protein [Verrucomicrobiales bacterium]
MKLSPKNLFHLFKTAAIDWMDDKAPRLGASLAFYTLFSLSPLLVLAVSLATLWFSENGTEHMFSQMSSLVGEKGSEALKSLLVQPENKGKGIFTSIVAFITLLVGSTAVFVQLQDALNEIWEVKQKPGQGIKGFIRHRLLSFAAVFGIGFLLLVSLILTAALSAAGKYMGEHIGGMEMALQILNFVLSLGVITVLFALMFKMLPDAKVAWKDVWFGAFITSLLFALGKWGIGLYLGKSSIASSYAAAGSLVIVLLWVYYSSQIMFFGAELTQVYARMSGREVVPSTHAMRDEAKLCQSKAKEREQKEAEKAKEKKHSDVQGGSHQPAFAFAKTAHARPATSAKVLHPDMVKGKTSTEAPGKKSTALGSMVLLLLVLWPLEKKLHHKSS